MNSGWLYTFFASLGALIISVIFTPLTANLAKRKKILSDPLKVRFYTSRKPVLGHIVLFIAFFLPMGIAFASGFFSDEFFYTLSDLHKMTVGLFFSSLFLVISATYSDARNDPGDYEWLYIIVSSVMLYFFEVRFRVLYLPFTGEVNLNIWGLPLLAIWVLLVVSIVELLDFFNGLAGGVIALVSGIYYLLHKTSGKNELYTPFFFAVLMGAVAGILFFQIKGPKIQYGKSGNKILGFLFAAGTVISYRKGTTGQFVIFPIAIFLFIVVTVNFLFLERQHRPNPGTKMR